MSRIRFTRPALGAALARQRHDPGRRRAFAAEPGGPAPVSAHVWVTTPDGADKLSDLGAVASAARRPPPRRWSSTPP